MAMKSWTLRSVLLLGAAISFWPVACVSGDPVDPDVNEVGVGGASGSAGRPGAGGATPAAGRGGSAGAAVGTGGAGMTTGGTPGVSGAGGTTSVGGATGVGGASGAGGSVPSGGMPGVGGVSGSAGAPVTGGVGPVAGSGGDAPIAGTGPVDPCANVTCGTGQTCMNGACMCMMGTLCSNACVDTQADANNCGGCGTKCDTGGACVDGKCVNPKCNPDTQVYNGHVTNYSLSTSMVACHYPTDRLPTYYGAMNQYDWQESGVCGACVEITNGGKKLVVQITDECPDVPPNTQWCFQGSHHIDLNGAANNALGSGNNPAVTWKYVPCTPMGNIQFYFDQAAQQYYLAVTPMNHRNLVAKMEVKKNGAWTTLTHTNYNTYEVKDGAGTGMMTFRLTDIYNHVVVDTVTMAPGKVVDGAVQFPACP